jgi:hypothetical protein
LFLFLGEKSDDDRGCRCTGDTATKPVVNGNPSSSSPKDITDRNREQEGPEYARIIIVILVVITGTPSSGVDLR